MLYFFLSYAREDDPERIRRFFDDLSSDVRDLAGADRDEQVGFLDDRSIQPGQRWVAELTEALASCRCFVALTSPRYFRRDYCGREWQVFHHRLLTYEQRWSTRAPSLLPVYWIPTDTMPALAAEIQRAGAQLGSREYREYGLRQMLDLKRFRDDYRTFVFDLARHIVATAKAHAIPRPRQPVSVREVPNIFHPNSDGPKIALPPGRAGGTARSEGGRRRARQRRYVHFVIVAGSRTEMASTHRRTLDYYGHQRVDWAPYRSSLDDTLGEFAAQIAAERQFESEVADVQSLLQRIGDAKQNNEVVVLLVDTWGLDIDEHRQALTAYDGHDETTTAVMVPFSSSDAETLGDTTVLQARLAGALPRRLSLGDRVMLRPNVPTHDHFSADLEEILEVAQNRIFERGTVNPKVPRRPPRSRPVLEGPGSTDGTSE